MRSVQYWILTSSVAISGIIQGMLLPVIAILFEQMGISPSLSGLHATGMYIGVLLISPFLERPLVKYGYKQVACVGVVIVLLSLISFTLTTSITAWFILRLLIGIGDHLLHFSTQTWITCTSEAHCRGKSISVYGLFFSLGFAIGPIFSQFVITHPKLPFYLASVLIFISLLALLTLKNTLPTAHSRQDSYKDSLYRMKQVWLLAWIALLPPFVYGFLETALHSSFPIYALRSSLTIEDIAQILPAFAFGSILTQVPLGILSDTLGRRRTLSIIFIIGSLLFFIGSIDSSSKAIIYGSFLGAGMVVGSTFSLGMSYMTDLIPNFLLPAGNVMCGIAFSLGSLVGPAVGGFYIDLFPNQSFLLLLAFVLLISFFIHSFSNQRPALERTKPKNTTL